MTFKEKLSTITEWKDRVTLISFYHHTMIVRHKGKWSVRKTAKYFNLSVGGVSEAIQLAKRIDELNDCITKKEALLRIK